MSIQVTGTNLDVGAALRNYAVERLEATVGKYVEEELSGHIRVEKNRLGFASRISVHLSWGLELQANGEAGDAHSAIDAAMERLDKRLRRHKRRLVDRHQTSHKAGGPFDGRVTDYVISADGQDEVAETTDGTGGPAIIAESQKNVLTHSVSDAVMALELSEDECLVFRNAGSGRLNVIYRRSDGNIGWIDPAQETTSEANP